MSALRIILIIDAVLLALLLIVLLVKYCTKINEAGQEDLSGDVCPNGSDSDAKEERAAEDAEENKEVSATADIPEDEDREENSDGEEKLVIGGLNIDGNPKRTPFYEKMLYADKKTQEYYNTIYNAFLMYRKINPRVSVKYASFRFGRELIAKITLHGKTMKLHLALDVKAFEEKVYFQKDLSAKKTYALVPFTVKIKSERGLKNALNLIDALMLGKGVEKKARHYVVDSIERLKALIK